MNPGPHGPEIYAVSSTEIVFEGFELISRLPRRFEACFSRQERPDYYMNLLHIMSTEVDG